MPAFCLFMLMLCLPGMDDNSTVSSSSVFHEAEKTYYAAPPKHSDLQLSKSEESLTDVNQNQTVSPPEMPDDTNASKESAADSYFSLSDIMADMAGVKLPSIDLSALTLPSDITDGKQTIKELGTTLGELMCGYMTDCAVIFTDMLSSAAK